ncbi:protein bric-a-brac 2-like isoform X1 [Vanessa atalanta]|uniref:protein bric-a-brac 2-like isoform X1 n=1 Tax=Vanessa atalanta TaxID=42275 RepID=UPI001FCDF344|nr:protein bric-a-brac 2-like isoform X1 [Vanessa atalanta]XP_047543654.1 protein bric-a-brac 2-like isoform X1 [Vanessa atalanta]
MSQQYSLRWNNHQPNFISMFGTLLATKNLVDVTLAAEGQHLVAHKVVLSACSTYFHSLFVDNPSHHPIVILKDVTFNNLCTMVDFMYYGEVNVTEEQLPQVLETAKILKIKGLTEMPDSTSLTRSQGASTDFPNPENSNETNRPSVSPSSPNIKRKRRRVSSTGSGVNLVTDDNRSNDCGQNLELMREAVTLSSLPQQKRRELDERMDNQVSLLTGEPSNINIDQLAIDSNAVGMSQGQWSMLEHTYPRYPNACLGGGGFQPDQGMYLNNVINQHGDPDMNHYGQTLGVPGPAPGPSCVAEAQPNQMQQMNPTPQRRRRQTNPQDAENFQKALEAVRVGGIGFCKAARLFGVNNRTLWLEYKKKGYPNNRPSIKSRIKREHVTPPPEHKEEPQQQDQQMALICPPHSVPVGFIDPRPVDFPLQVNNAPLNIINGVNFPMQ